MFWVKSNDLNSILNGKTTEIETFLQSIIFTPKNVIKNVSFCTDCTCYSVILLLTDV